MSVWAVLILIIAFAALAYFLGRSRGRTEATGALLSPYGGAPALASGEAAADPLEAIRGLLPALLPLVETAATPEEMVGNDHFESGVRRLSSCELSELLDLFRGESAITAWMAMESIARREAWEPAEETLVAHLNSFIPWSRHFLCRALAAGRPAERPVIHRVLAGMDDSWRVPSCRVTLQRFVAGRLDAGEWVDVEAAFAQVADEQLQRAEALLADASHTGTRVLRARIEEHRKQRVDLDALGRIGRVWTLETPDEGGTILEHRGIVETLDKARESVLASPGRSMLLVGPSGVGKTTAIRAIARELLERGDIVFEASSTDLIADKPYIGQLEGAMRKLVDALSGKRVVWYVPNLAALRQAGRHQHSSVSLLDIVFPAIAAGRIVVLGETSPSAFDMLVQAEPRIVSAFHTHRVEPTDAPTTLALGERWLRAEDVEASAEVLDDAALLATEFLAGRANPGAFLELLDAATSRPASAEVPRASQLTREDLIATIARLTGLPRSILDDCVGLDPDEVEAFFSTRVRGQPEAVRCLVERIAMMKAGVTDPTRPQGVFLFAGPTGTGKTELAKTLAEYLFGSPNRLVRVDMSELQAPENMERLLGSPGQESSNSLVAKLRKEPFSVVLLDEFEKAHPKVWDLFLQVFDDGRLTDDAGREADFRHAIVILTSNLGAAIPHGVRLGFGDDRSGFQSASVEKVIARAFRPEFLNRLDRTIVFRPLSRETLRDILHRELEQVFRRRGLRTRSWAVEWDESAIDFLLERGYTEELGARPLKRAVERYLLAPLADTIVRHRAPQGDQFLFVRARRDRLVVEFVDPDATDEHEQEVGDTRRIGARHSLLDVALGSDGSREDLAVVAATLESVEARITGEVWPGIKERVSAEMSSPEFWTSEARFASLGVLEYQDRIEAGFKTASSVLGRIADEERERVPTDLLSRLALRAHLLDVAVRDVLEQRPHDAFLSIESAQDSEEGREFTERLADMYGAWASKRNMRLDELDEADAARRRKRRVWSVSGYGAYSLLAGEDGLHVMEIPLEDRRSFRRVRARVRVAPQPATPPHEGKQTLAAQAAAALRSEEQDELIIARRYREAPSPLVRDASGWKTGLLERVFAGDFDLFAACDHEGVNAPT
jgi:ATP-dependent Clp protease ATP-binding subunit ClpC